jgi:hypothetical protein
LPWFSDEAGIYSEAGERRIEIKLQLRLDLVTNSPEAVEEGTSLPPSASDAGAQALVIAETRLRKEFEACLLTREEAVALEAGDTNVHNSIKVGQWEAVRAGGLAGAPPRSWSPVFGTLEVVLRLVSAVPGSASLAAIGGAMAHRATCALEAATGLEFEHERKRLEVELTTGPL